MDKPKRDWFVKVTVNGGVCECCGKAEYPYIDGICKATTDGLRRMYGHPEFQLVVDYGINAICYILNTLGDAVRGGKVFSDNEFITGIFEDCAVKLAPITVGGEKMFRVIIPDRHNVWPENPACEYPYNQQLKPLSSLKRKGGLCDE